MNLRDVSQLQTCGLNRCAPGSALLCRSLVLLHSCLLTLLTELACKCCSPVCLFLSRSPLRFLPALVPWHVNTATRRCSASMNAGCTIEYSVIFLVPFLVASKI